jgi:hypothetical protein
MAIGYCDGKGGVTLRFSTSEQMHHWDLVPEKYLMEEKANWHERTSGKKSLEEMYN